MKHTTIAFGLIAASLFITSTASAHHMAPDELSDLIEERLIEADSPHLLSSDEDPSLAGSTPGMDADYVMRARALAYTVPFVGCWATLWWATKKGAS